MENQTSIYTLHVKQTVSQTYQIQAETKEEAMRAAAKLWSKAKDSCYKNSFWDATELRITGENSQPSTDELKYVDNK